MRLLKGVLLLSLIAALATPGSALAQSAGDDQYVDPFQNENPGANNGGSGGGASQDGGQEDNTGSVPPATPDEPAVTVDPEAAGSAEGTAAQSTADEAVSLPNTGLPAAALALTGGLMLAGGAALRRRA